MPDQITHPANFTYLLLDAARILEQLETAQELQPAFICLYTGDSAKLLLSVAPYLFNYQKDSAFEKWYAQKCWGNSAGFFVETVVTMEELHKHFRKFLLVKTEQGKELYFRFYDPRVLRVFLPTCDTAQLKDFFGPIKHLICEDEDTAFATRYSFDGIQLMKEKIDALFFMNTNELPNVKIIQAENSTDAQKPKSPRKFIY
ncbi:MAG: DUF4123 domain-containing protein [Ferruginibacter sp.]